MRAMAISALWDKSTDKIVITHLPEMKGATPTRAIHANTAAGIRLQQPRCIRKHMLKIFVGNLSPDTREAELRDLFAQHGAVRSIKLASDIFTGKCRGIGFIEMEGHEARAAMAALNGSIFKGQAIKVNEERPRDKRFGRGRR
jgi:RNA recognition motif-containing protein